MKALDVLTRQPKPVLTAAGLILVAALGIVDHLTGFEVSFSIFYVIPISLTSWLVSRRSGAGVSVASAVAWLAADLSSGHTYSHIAIPFWNAVVRLSLFLIVTFALSAFRKSLDRHEDMIHYIVHDIKSPLSNMMGGLETLQLDSGDKLSQFDRELVRLSLQSGKRALALIESLLDLSRLEQNRLKVQVVVVDAGELLSKAIDQVALWAAQKGVSITPEIDADVKTVCADSDLTERVLVNLLNNAVKFSPSDSSASVRVAAHPPNMVAFSVTNSGSGVPKEWATKVFDKYVQVDTHQAGVPRGTGLGLAFCRLAVQAQSGRIWLESELGKSTTVTFTLPEA